MQTPSAFEIGPNLVQIATDGTVMVAGRPTMFGVRQGRHGTIAYIRENLLTGTKYRELDMPKARYALSTDPGRRSFVEDLICLSTFRSST